MGAILWSGAPSDAKGFQGLLRRQSRKLLAGSILLEEFAARFLRRVWMRNHRCTMPGFSFSWIKLKLLEPCAKSARAVMKRNSWLCMADHWTHPTTRPEAAARSIPVDPSSPLPQSCISKGM